MHAQQKKKTLSTIEAARILGVAVSSVSKWIDGGILAAGRTPGGHRRIEAEDLVAFLRKHKLRVPKELQPDPPRILIVDDDKSFTKWLAEEIAERRPEFEVIRVHDGYSAGEVVGLARPDVVILDLRMPGIDGFEVCRRIKSNPLTKQTCVIGITANASASARSRIRRMGACACLEKPLDVAAVSNEIAKAVDRSR